MKLLLLLLHFTVLPHLAQASRLVNDTLPPAGAELLKELELTDEHKGAIKIVLLDYKLNQAKQKRELRKKYWQY
jgi:hypothetical protein